MTQFTSTAFYKKNINKEVYGKQINNITNNGTFYKCLSYEPDEDLTCYLGLNINSPSSLNLDGFRITDKNNIIYYFYAGRYLADIKIPDDARCVIDNNGGITCDKFFVESINLIKEHDLLKDDNFRLKMEKIGYVLLLNDNHTDELCIDAINKNKYEFLHVDKQTENICMYVAEQNYAKWNVLKIIKNQTEDMCIKIIKNKPYLLSDVKNQTENICLEAVKQDGYLIVNVINKTEKICMEAVKQNGMVLQYIKNQTHDICMEAVKQNGMALQFVKYQADDICMEAIKQDCMALQFVISQTREQCAEAVEQDIISLKYINGKKNGMIILGSALYGHISNLFS